MKHNVDGDSSEEELKDKNDEESISNIKTEIKLNEPKLILMESQKVIEDKKTKGQNITGSLEQTGGAGE